jgi:hypothetical protein
MYTEQHTVTLPYALDERYADILELVEALEAKWAAERNPDQD